MQLMHTMQLTNRRPKFIFSGFLLKLKPSQKLGYPKYSITANLLINQYIEPVVVIRFSFNYKNRF